MQLTSHVLNEYVCTNKQKIALNTVGEVAAARSGSKPPQDAIRLSAS